MNVLKKIGIFGLPLALLLFLCLYGFKTQKPAVPAAPSPLPSIGDIAGMLKHLQPRVTGAAFTVHTVKMKENLWKIAAKHRYSVHTIIGCNPHLTTYNVDVNQQILLPSKAGVVHVIRENDDWDSVARRYAVSPAVLKQANLNVARLNPGEMLFVPGAQPLMEYMNEAMREKYELRSLFVSPLGGRLTSFFGGRKHPVTGQRSRHGGIDIAVKEGTWVGAAAAGVVQFAGGGAGHYGIAVFIDHRNGYVTHYGHLSRVYVRPGQKVKARQLIARSGSTGRSTGPHLHFTIKKNGVAVDPLRYLW